MNKVLSNQYYLFIVRIILASIFILSGIEKISDPEQFAVSISNYRILPNFAVNIFAITLSWVELFSGVLLLFGVWIKENSFIITGLLSIFTIMIVIALIRGLDIDCGCFGSLHTQMIGLQKVVENLFQILFGISLILYNSKLFTRDNIQND